MSLKRKIVLSFFISAFIIAILAAFEYLNFVEIKKEIRYLEITDTISRKSLQLRRHEKNYFLYSPENMEEESAAVHAYLGELKDLLTKNPEIDRADNLSLRNSIAEYERQFTSIESEARRLTRLFSRDQGNVPEKREEVFPAGGSHVPRTAGPVRRIPGDPVPSAARPCPDERPSGPERGHPRSSGRPARTSW